MSPGTAVLPEDWETRLTPVCNENTGGATGWCIDPIDLTIAKLAAARPKEITFIRGMLKHHLIRVVDVELMIATFRDEDLRERLTNAFTVCRRTE